MEAKALNWEVPSNSMLIVNHVDPGPNHFDGYTALQYARLRKIDNDWKRVERQRTVIKAVLDQVQNASVMELDNLLNTILPLIQTNFYQVRDRRAARAAAGDFFGAAMCSRCPCRCRAPTASARAWMTA